MWRIDEIVAAPVELDFSSSGGGRRAATAVTTAGDCLFNAIELVDVEPTITQVQVCVCCGIPHCAPGNWVAFRRIGEDVVWVPAWSEMEKGEFEIRSTVRPHSCGLGVLPSSVRHAGTAFASSKQTSSCKGTAADQFTRARPPVPVDSLAKYSANFQPNRASTAIYWSQSPMATSRSRRTRSTTAFETTLTTPNQWRP